MKLNRWLASYFFLAFSMAGCITETSTPAIQPTQTTIIEAPAIPSPTNASSLPARCRDLKQENGLPASDKVRGSSIVYEAYALDNENLVTNPVWEVSLNDGSEKLLSEKLPTTPNTDDVISYGFTLYSSDGEHVAIWKYSFEPIKPENTYPLIIHNKDNSKDIVVFQSNPGESIQGNWSPDGNYFVFTWYKNIPEYYSVVYSVNADGTGLKELTGHIDKETLERPYWSPNGQQIAIPVWSKSGGMDIMIINYQTDEIKRFKVSPIIRIYPSSIWDSKPQTAMLWSSDSEWFVYISQYEHNGIEILNIENGSIYCVENEKIFGVEKLVWRYDNP
jgi:hypothetical protein